MRKGAGLKVALINATKNDYGYLEPPLGILSIASYLIHKGIVKKKNVMVLDTSIRNPMDFLKYFRPNLVGLSAMTTAYPDAINLGKKIKKIFGTPIIIGGIHITVRPDQLQFPFDVGVLGEGEETFFELVKTLSKAKSFKPEKLEKIKGIVFRDGQGKLRLTEPRPLIDPLDKIPPIDWSLIPTRVYFGNVMVRVNGEWRPVRQPSIFTARGCPYNCVFCARKTVWPGVRFFSVKRVMREIENLVKNYSVEAIHIWDDCFTLSKKRVRGLIKAMEKKKLLGKVVFTEVFARTDQIDEDFLRLLKKMGVITLYFGFESGSDKILGFLKNHTVTVADNKRAVELTDKFGIGIIGSFMLASPNETKEDMEKTLNFIRWAIKKESFLRLEICKTTPYPGTQLWQYALKQGIVSDDMDLNRLRQNVPSRKTTELFFKEKITFEDYDRIWNKGRKLVFLVKRRNEKQKGAPKTMKIIHRRELFNHTMLTFDLIWQDFKNKRFWMGTRRTLDKLMSHLLSTEKIKEDLGKAKIVFSPLVKRNLTNFLVREE